MSPTQTFKRVFSRGNGAAAREEVDVFSASYRSKRGHVRSAQFGVPTEIFERRDAIRKRLEKTIASMRSDGES